MSGRELQMQAEVTTVAENLQGSDLVVARAAMVPRPFVDQLIDKSMQPHVLDATPDDYRIRFRDAASVEAWQHARDGLAFYMLLGRESTELAGAIWHHPAEFPENFHIDPARAQVPKPNHTFAVRVYDPYKGRGLARPFMRACIADYAQLEQTASDFRGIWLSTSARPANRPTVDMYRRFGYIPYGASADRQRVAMLLSPERVVQIRRHRQHEA